ncbi:organic cation transporter protein-like isoform X1 [Microplitis mediator]|uniref:organic cation transporter protein-like isoform X1 n=1 Tax=Microplitis mediator TaxID=375433 RepID=UPI00255279BE|nr:organic cation transporter protein-like isoform X1 [Microplitis mediator]
MEIKENKLVEEKYFLQAIDDLGKGSKLLWIVFIINLSTTLLFGINSMSYVFIGEIPKYWCSTPELTSANWTTNEINNISIVDTCQRYDYNYTQLVELGYEKAVQHVKNFESKPKIVSCSSFIFDDNGRSTIVSEWQLVCDKKLHRANTFLVFSLGIMSGSAILGVYADKYGRKNSLIISIILHTIAGPLSALVPWFWAYIVLKFFTGMSLGAMYSSAYTIFSEVVKSKRRKLFVGMLDSTFSVGTFFLIGMAYFLPNWRQLQMAISCFVLPIVILIWFMPESPRWLISQNRHDEAQKIIEKYHKSFVMTPISIVGSSTNEPTMSSGECDETLNENKSFFHRNFESLRILFTHSDLRKKIIIMNFSYYVTTAASYSLAFNVENLKSNRYVYMSILSANEVLGNSIISVVLLFFSCRKSLVTSYTVAFILMITILAIPEENKNTIIGLALAAKFCFSANYTANLVLFSKLFPSNVRNTAFGTCIVMGQTGAMTAPYIVDLLGNVAWWAPTTLCSVLSLMTGILCLAIPRTKVDN